MNLKFVKQESQVWTTTATNERTAAGELSFLDRLQKLCTEETGMKMLKRFAD